MSNINNTLNIERNRNNTLNIERNRNTLNIVSNRNNTLNSKYSEQQEQQRVNNTVKREQDSEQW